MKIFFIKIFTSVFPGVFLLFSAFTAENNSFAQTTIQTGHNFYYKSGLAFSQKVLRQPYYGVEINAAKNTDFSFGSKFQTGF
jgi:hypothetical protein